MSTSSGLTGGRAAPWGPGVWGLPTPGDTQACQLPRGPRGERDIPPGTLLANKQNHTLATSIFLAFLINT